MLCICACDKAPSSVTAPSDPWLNMPADVGTEVETISPDTHHIVVPEHTAEAIPFLDELMTSQISPGEAHYFAGETIDQPDTDRPFLIRGAYRSVREFTVRVVGDALWVASHDVAGDTAPVKQQPLLLIIREVPDVVYVSTGLAP